MLTQQRIADQPGKVKCNLNDSSLLFFDVSSALFDRSRRKVGVRMVTDAARDRDASLASPSAF